MFVPILLIVSIALSSCLLLKRYTRIILVLYRLLFPIVAWFSWKLSVLSVGSLELVLRRRRLLLGSVDQFMWSRVAYHRLLDPYRLLEESPSNREHVEPSVHLAPSRKCSSGPNSSGSVLSRVSRVNLENSSGSVLSQVSRVNLVPSCPHRSLSYTFPNKHHVVLPYSLFTLRILWIYSPQICVRYPVTSWLLVASKLHSNSTTTMLEHASVYPLRVKFSQYLFHTVRGTEPPSYRCAFAHFFVIS